jgi:hypothetical protein
MPPHRQGREGRNRGNWGLDGWRLDSAPVAPLSDLTRSLTGPGAAAARGRWLARGAWLLAAAEVVVAIRNHVTDRLSEKERRRLVEIVKSSRGRPSKLDDRERRELQRLLGKIEPKELLGTVARSGLGRRLGGARVPRKRS